jgi:hypothetical protein
MNWRSCANVVFLGLMIFLAVTSWALPGTATPGIATASGMCSLPATVPNQADSDATEGKYYVAVTGSDSNPGTLYLPWKTIQHAANSVDAGETVYIRGGVYHESVDIEVSGSATEGPVTFQSYPAEQAILDGDGLIAPASDIRGLINIEDQSYVIIKGLEFRNYQTANASSTPAGIVITGAGGHIQLLNNIVHNIATTSKPGGDALGIAVYGSESPEALEDITVSDNQVYELKTGSSESVVVSGNVINFAITCNVVHDADNTGIAVIGFEEVSADPAVDYPRNGTISRNTVYRISSSDKHSRDTEYNADGISVDSAAEITIDRNLIDKVDTGIEIGAERKGHAARNVTVRNNLVYRANSAGITIGGDSQSAGGADQITLVNNTLFGNDTQNTGSGEFQIRYHVTNIAIRNNIVSATSQGLFINSYVKAGADPADLDYNLYFSSVSVRDAEFLWKGKDYNGFASYQSATGRDRHSKYADPKFLSSEAMDLRLQPSSPAVGAGINPSGELNGDVDFSGNARMHETNIDMGAYQLQNK